LVGTGTDNQDKGLKALRTNVFNRLLIMSIEDVGIGSPAMPILVSKLATNYAIGNKDLRRKSLYILTKNLCNARKSRETSHLRCVYS
jgi:replication-associated recombination protein RarA